MIAAGFGGDERCAGCFPVAVCDAVDFLAQKANGSLGACISGGQSTGARPPRRMPPRARGENRPTLAWRVPPARTPNRRPAGSMKIDCERLTKTYEGADAGPLSALEDVTFSVGENEFIGIVGPSGCGKTTLLKIIGGLAEPTSGRVVMSETPDERRPQSALVFQDHGLFPWMTVLDNVAFGLQMYGVSRRERHARARAFIDRVGLAQFKDTYPDQLSVGMQQRVGIIRAFVTDPPILLMDEPFGALDSQTRIVLQEELLRIWDDHPKVVIFITHDIDEAIRLSDRILVMSGRPGRILEEVPIPLLRPREIAKRKPAAVRDIKWHIWGLLEEQVRESLWVAD